MSRGAGQTIGDLIGIGAGLFVLLGGAFDTGTPAGDRIIEGMAFFVILLSVWRIWRRWRHMQ